MEFGLYTLSDLVPDPHNGSCPDPRRRIQETIAAAKLADDAGFEVFGIGEHHRLDFAVSSPVPVLSAIAAVTKRIRLTSAVTVLGAADPVRVFQDFSTLDVVSEGRAEIIAGRGVFVEAFPLFGHSLTNYDELFEEKFALLHQLGDDPRITWRGRFRQELDDAEIAPRPIQDRIPVWVGVGGTPQSAVRAGRMGAPMALAALGGPIVSVKSLVDMYRAASINVEGADTRVAITSHLHVGDTSRSARDTFHPYYSQYWAMATPRGRTERMPRATFERSTGPDTALLVGSGNEVAEKIIATHGLLKHDRLLAQIDIASLPFREVARVIERLAVQVLPQVRRAIGDGPAVTRRQAIA